MRALLLSLLVVNYGVFSETPRDRVVVVVVVESAITPLATPKRPRLRRAPASSSFDSRENTAARRSSHTRLVLAAAAVDRILDPFSLQAKSNGRLQFRKAVQLVGAVVEDRANSEYAVHAC